MISRKQESIHEPAGMQKRFGLLCLLVAAAIVLLTLSGTQAAAGEREARFSVLYNFCSQPNCADGSQPNASLIRDEAGNLYGTTYSGGSVGAGVIFKLDPRGNETVLYNFTFGEDSIHNPNPGLTRDESGNLYGTAGGGSTGAGVVFKLDPSGQFTVLYNFTFEASPNGSLIRDEAGNLYGTTQYGGNGGSSCRTGIGCGLVYKLDGSGNETVLYSFSGGADGSQPHASLIRDEAGNLYGTTFEGGNVSSPSCAPVGCGVVFKLDPSGKETVLYSFTGGADGAAPFAPLVRDPAGNLYGTTEGGGYFSTPIDSFCAGGCGVAFQLDRRGKFTVLYPFTGPEGAHPFGGLTLGNGGLWDPTRILYGATTFGGNLSSPTCNTPPFVSGCGVVFKLDRWGKETVLHTFQGPDGNGPTGEVLLKHHRSLYGATDAGGTNGGGVIFKIKLDDDDHEYESDH